MPDFVVRIQWFCLTTQRFKLNAISTCSVRVNNSDYSEGDRFCVSEFFKMRLMFWILLKLCQNRICWKNSENSGYPFRFKIKKGANDGLEINKPKCTIQPLRSNKTDKLRRSCNNVCVEN